MPASLAYTGGIDETARTLGGSVMAEGGIDGSSDAVSEPPSASTAAAARSIFISYAASDVETANSACRYLESRGVNCWIAPRNVKPGAQYADAIVRAINEATAVVVVMSASAMASSHVRREVERAAAKHKPIIAFRIDAAALNPALEYFLSESQWIDVPAVGLEPAFEKLASAMGEAASAPAAPINKRPGEIARPKSARLSRTALAVGAAAAAAVLALAALLVFGPRNAANHWRDPLAEAKVMRLTDFTGTEQAAAISRDGRFVAFLADRDGHVDAWVTEIGSNTYRNLTQGQVAQLSNSSIRSVGFSPDGSQVTLWTRSADGSRPEDIQLMAVPVGGGALQLYLKQAAEVDWSPDASRLVFHTPAPGDPLFVREAQEPTAHQIYVAPSNIHCHFPIWSPDGKFIYFVRGEPPGNWDVWRLRPSGTGLERLTFHNTRVTYPVLLDAQTLMYLATEADGSGPWLYAMDVPSKFERRVSVGLERYTSLAATANGSRLVATVATSRSDLWSVKFDSNGPPQTAAAPVVPAIQSAFAPRFGPGYLAYVSIAGGRRGIWKLANGTATELWDDPAAARIGAPAIAPDGRRIAFTVESQEAKQLYVINSDGGHPRVIGAALALRGDLGWTPDSQSLIGAIERNGEPRLAKVALDDTPPQPLVSEYSIDPAWSPDGKFVVYSGADVATTFPVRAASPDGRPYGMASLILTRGARRVAFARNSGSLIILRGGVGYKNFWLWDPKTGAERQLTDLPSTFDIGDFDVSPDAAQIVFDRVQESSSIALFERAP
jgi:Tol biopolymer transport system component